jgi:hypothetical protein
MRLVEYDFTMTHRAGKLNPVDPPLRRPDYTEVREVNNTLLLTLQNKLAVFLKGLHSKVGMVLEILYPNLSSTPNVYRDSVEETSSNRYESTSCK